MSTSPSAVVSQNVQAEPSYAELKARLEELLRKQANEGSKLKVTAKGSISHYCLGKFPVTLTAAQWEIVIKTVKSGELESFIAKNSAMLYRKQK